jgi:hypothetical protein
MQKQFFTHLIHFLFRRLENFPRVSIRSVSKIQRSNGAVSSYRLISKVISESFTQLNEATSWRRRVVFSRDSETVVSPHYSVSATRTERFYRGAGSQPICPITYMTLYLETVACGSFNWRGIRKGLRQPIIFEEVLAR